MMRVHFGLGTADWTLFNAKRHQGAFGGLQFQFRRDLGAMVVHDGGDLIAGLCCIAGNTGLMVRAGIFGDHWLVGAAFRRSFRR